MDGVSLLQAAGLSATIFGETQQSVFATDGRYKYIHYFAGGCEQLFDVSSDA